jgi:hypothetical protein
MYVCTTVKSDSAVDRGQEGALKRLHEGDRVSTVKSDSAVDRGQEGALKRLHEGDRVSTVKSDSADPSAGIYVDRGLETPPRRKPCLSAIFT